MLHRLNQGILKGEVSLYHWPPVWLVWISLFWQIKSKNVSTHTADSKPLFSIPWLNVYTLLKVGKGSEKDRKWGILKHKKWLALISFTFIHASGIKTFCGLKQKFSSANISVSVTFHLICDRNLTIHSDIAITYVLLCFLMRKW